MAVYYGAIRNAGRNEGYIQAKREDGELIAALNRKIAEQQHQFLALQQEFNKTHQLVWLGFGAVLGVGLLLAVKVCIVALM